MDENNNSSAIRLLVDALSKTLQSLSDKISSFQPILNQISQTTNSCNAEVSQILYDVKNIEKKFDELCKDFYDRTNLIIKNIDSSHNKIEGVTIKFDKSVDNIGNLFTEKTESIGKLFTEKTESIGKLFENKTVILNDSLDEKTTALANTINNLDLSLQSTTKNLIIKINDVNKNIRPVNKFFQFISKPMGLLIFISGLLIASITITNVTSTVMDYFSKTVDNYKEIKK